MKTPLYNGKVCIDEYQQLLIFQNATFTLIDHEDAMVAKVFKITKTNGEHFK